MKHRYVQIDGELVEVPRDWMPEPRADHHIMDDIKPYRSMIDGSEITSRSKHREHLRMHGCIEVGNDSSLYKPRQPIASPPGLKEKVIQAVNAVEERKRRSKCH